MFMQSQLFKQSYIYAITFVYDDVSAFNLAFSLSGKNFLYSISYYANEVLTVQACRGEMSSAPGCAQRRSDGLGPLLFMWKQI